MHAEPKLIGARDRSQGSESSTVKPNRVESKTHHMVQTVILSQPNVWKLLLAHLVKVNVCVSVCEEGGVTSFCKRHGSFEFQTEETVRSVPVAAGNETHTKNAEFFVFFLIKQRFFLARNVSVITAVFS